MGWVTSIVVLVLVWWTVLFTVLPMWTRPKAEADEASGWRGTPDRPLLGRKLLVTTAVSLVVWGAIMAVIGSDALSFRPALDR